MDGVRAGVRAVMAEPPLELRGVELSRENSSVMIVGIEVPDLATVLAHPVEAKEQAGIAHATVSDPYFEEGDKIEEDQDLVEMTTDKATFNVPATASGTVTEVFFEEGDIVQVGEVLAVIEKK